MKDIFLQSFKINFFALHTNKLNVKIIQGKAAKQAKQERQAQQNRIAGLKAGIKKKIGKIGFDIIYRPRLDNCVFRPCFGPVGPVFNVQRVEHYS